MLPIRTCQSRLSAASILAGLGFGGIDYGLNDLFATAFTRRGPAMLNVLNAHFGVGAIASPFLVALLSPERYPMVFLGLATVPPLATVAYAGVGLFIAPVFPTGLPWLHRAIPGARQAGAYVIAASMLGGVAFPPVLGVGIERIGTSSVPALLFGLNALCLATIWWITMAERRFTGVSRHARPAGDRTAA